MIFRWFFWKYIKLSFLISFLITFLFLMTQMIRFDQVILSLPLMDLIPFFLFMFSYYFLYILPLSIFIAFSLVLFEFKESKKLKILQSFGIDPKSIYLNNLLYMTPLIIAIAFAMYFLREEDIKYLRSNLTVKYYTYILTSIPSKTFNTFGQFTLYTENREGKELENIFFKFQEGVIIAKKAYVEEEEIIFKKGSFLAQRDDKTFSVDFDTYRLNLKEAVPDVKKGHEYIVGIINGLSPPILTGFSYLLVRLIEHHHVFYYVIGLMSILHQFFLLLLKQTF